MIHALVEAGRSLRNVVANKKCHKSEIKRNKKEQQQKEKA